jgi:hypothetical protein
MKIYNVLINDRHAEPEIRPFVDKQDAIEFAKKTAKKYCHSLEDLKELQTIDWLYHIVYSCEGDSIWVTEHNLENKL